MEQKKYLQTIFLWIKVGAIMEYTLPLSGFAPYVNFGLSSTLHLNSSSTWIQEVPVIGDIVERYEHKALTMRKHQIGGWVGGGILKSLNSRLNAYVEFRYDRADGLAARTTSIEPILLSRVTSFQVLIGIKTR